MWLSLEPPLSEVRIYDGPADVRPTARPREPGASWPPPPGDATEPRDGAIEPRGAPKASPPTGDAPALRAPLAPATPPLRAPANEPPREPGVTAQSPPDPTSAPLSSWTIGGFADLSYQGSTNLPDNHVYRLMATSPRTGEFVPNLVGMYVVHTPTKRAPYAFELAGHAGPAADALVATEPLPGGASSQNAGPNVWRHIARANVGFRLFRSGTSFGFGLYSCPIGIGTFWTKDNWHYTAPWQLQNVPFYIAGARVDQTLGKLATLSVFVLNGWQTLADVNRVPSYLASLSIKPVAGLEILQNTWWGAETPDTRLAAWRFLSDTQLIYTRDRLGLGLLVDLGRERLTALPGRPVSHFAAFEGSVRVLVVDARHDWFLAVRAEAYRDGAGAMTGVKQWLGSGTVTSDLRLFDHLLLRLEYRYDQSSARNGFFYRGAATTPGAAGLAASQHTFIVGLTGMFEWRLPSNLR